jgi:uncharacterized membrane protein
MSVAAVCERWGTSTSKAELELEARTALLDYYKSLMQDYKIYLVTLAIAVLTIMDIWSRDPEKISGMYVSFLCVRLLYLSLGVVVSILFGFAWRWAWCGQIVTAVINVSPPKGDPTLANLDRAAKNLVYAEGGLGKKLLWGIASFDSLKNKAAFAFVCAVVLAAFSYWITPLFVAQIHP